MSPLLRLVWAFGYTLTMGQRAVWAARTRRSDEEVRNVGPEWARGLAQRMGIEVVSHGAECVDWSRPCIVMANHQSYLDILALYSTVPPFGMLAKKELYRIPFFGSALDAFGCVQVDRGSSKAARSIERAAEKVRSGQSIILFPEGTRSRGDLVAPFKKGPFYLAQAAHVPIIPVGIRNTAKLMPRENTGIHPGTIEVYVGRPLPPIDDSSPEARAELCARVRAEIARLAAVPMMD